MKNDPNKVLFESQKFIRTEIVENVYDENEPKDNTQFYLRSIWMS